MILVLSRNLTRVESSQPSVGLCWSRCAPRTMIPVALPSQLLRQVHVRGVPQGASDVSCGCCCGRSGQPRQLQPHRAAPLARGGRVECGGASQHCFAAMTTSWTGCLRCRRSTPNATRMLVFVMRHGNAARFEQAGRLVLRSTVVFHVGWGRGRRRIERARPIESSGFLTAPALRARPLQRGAERIGDLFYEPRLDLVHTTR